jgi:hypothetical protein
MQVIGVKHVAPGIPVPQCREFTKTCEACNKERMYFQENVKPMTVANQTLGFIDAAFAEACRS